MKSRALRRMRAPLAVLAVLIVIGAVTMAGARGLMQIAEDTQQSVVGPLVVSDQPCGARRVHLRSDGPPQRPRGACEEPVEEADEIPAEVLEARAEACRDAVGELPSPPRNVAAEIDHAIARVLELCRTTPDAPGLLEALRRLAEHRAQLIAAASADEPYRLNAVAHEARVLEG